MKKIFKSLALLSVLTLAACAQPELPKDHYYRLQVQAPENNKGATLFKGTIEVERFLADGLTAGRPIVYSEAGSEHQLLEYHYHFWTEPPVVMLRDQMIDFLRAARVSEMIVSPEMRSRPDYRLTAKIKRLEKIVGPKPSAIAELQLGLQDEQSGEIIHLANYRVEVGAQSDSVGDAVIAMNKALTEIYTRFVASLGKL
ncbi:MAG: membrane integrity-associated transporter subunit PqiC [Rhodospirillaceae bacterium]|nr:membrane integrity-associated transporter subunit PqiC [Rhodospirillaceae bacterium]MBL6941390.1 membrane integrity-associated transporter subunit PqiC [Rhodospirillales bacterium]